MRFRYLVPVGLVASLLWFSLPWAQAHADLVSSKPAVDSHLASLPSRVEVTFDGDLLVIGRSKTNVLIVKNSQGIQIDAKDSKVLASIPIVNLGPSL
jgi:methionine-rich copper-binding protein CopC